MNDWDIIRGYGRLGTGQVERRRDEFEAAFDRLRRREDGLVARVSELEKDIASRTSGMKWWRDRMIESALQIRKLTEERLELQNNIGGYITQVDELCEQRAEAWRKIDALERKSKTLRVMRDNALRRVEDLEAANGNETVVAARTTRDIQQREALTTAQSILREERRWREELQEALSRAERDYEIVVEDRQKLRERIQAIAHALEDQELLSDPQLQQSLEEMHRGELIDLVPTTMMICAACRGQGDTHGQQCLVCGGKGEIEVRKPVQFCGRTDLVPHRFHTWWRRPDGSYGDNDAGEPGEYVYCLGEE